MCSISVASVNKLHPLKLPSSIIDLYGCKCITRHLGAWYFNECFVEVLRNDHRPGVSSHMGLSGSTMQGSKTWYVPSE